MSFSTYKKCNLTKVILLTLPDGYVVHVGELSAADNHCLDPRLLEHALATINADKWLKQGDEIIADSGFADAVVPHGIILRTTGVRGSSEQLETGVANQNRAISQVRYAVENTNMAIKEFKLLHDEVDVKSLPHLINFVKLAAALSNQWRLHHSVR